MEIYPDTIKDIAVDCVTQFINNKQPLSAGLAKHASELGLNAEQVKRSVEATNQIGYLTLLGKNPDRTFEFPVAKYEDVMAHMVLPTETAASTPAPSAPSQLEPSVEKTASTLPRAELEAFARKGIMANHALLADLEIEKAAVLIDIGALVAKVKKDDWIIEKIAEIATEEEFPKLVKLATGKDACNVDVRKHVFNDSELSEARALSGLLKKAYSLVEKQNHAKVIDEAHFKNGDLFKSAAVRPESPLPPTGVGKTLASITGGAARGTSYAAGVLSAPIARPVKNLTHRALASTENVMHGVLGEGVLGKKRFQPAKPFKKILPRGIAPLDVAFAVATPVEPEKSVWNILHGSGKRY